LVENLNGRLRNYFFQRRNLGQGYLDLLRFFLNHRVFMRSERPERVGQKPYGTYDRKATPALAGATRLRVVPATACFRLKSLGFFFKPLPS